jgi:cytochrome P450
MCTAREGFDVLRSEAATTMQFKQAAPTLIGESMFGRDGAAHQQSRSALNAPFTPRGLATANIGARVAELVTARADEWVRRKTVAVLPEGRGRREPRQRWLPLGHPSRRATVALS